jgi:hypothetical protein
MVEEGFDSQWKDNVEERIMIFIYYLIDSMAVLLYFSFSNNVCEEIFNRR